MKDRTGNTADRKPRLALVGQMDVAGAVRAAFADREQVLLPILELVENARASIDELMNGAARGFVEQLLVLSAQEVAGAKHPGRRMGEVHWPGSQPGRVVLAEWKLTVRRPRLRRRAGRGKEVAIPVYERLQAEPRRQIRLGESSALRPGTQPGRIHLGAHEAARARQPVSGDDRPSRRLRAQPPEIHAAPPAPHRSVLETG